MSSGRVLYHLARADFLERTRRYSFLITVALAIYAAYLYLPPLDAPYLTFGLGGYRGVYNSAWVGAVVAVLCSTLLTLPGFYLVKGAVLRDQDTGVGEILATTPLTRWHYSLGKLLSNFVFLAFTVAVIAIAGLAMQQIRGEVRGIDLGSFLAPLLFATLPVMALVAALAVLFETIAWLRGGLGNVVYFFVWLAVLMASMMFSQIKASGEFRATDDPLGVTPIVASITAAAREQFPEYDGRFSIGAADVSGPVQTFEWTGVAWTARAGARRLLWTAAAIGLALVAARLFDRFDPAVERSRRRAANDPAELAAADLAPSAMVAIAPRQLSRLTGRSAGPFSQFARTLLAEVRLMLKGLRWWWYMVAVGLALATLLSPLDVARAYLLPAAWIWPVLVWSPMGSREQRHHTRQLIFSAAHPMRRQLPAAWCAGWLIAALTGNGLAVRLIATGEWYGLVAWGVGAAFIPALALALGTWSGSSKLFEVVYVLWWYAGPMTGVPELDYIGATREPGDITVSLAYLVLAVLLLALAVLGRQRQLHA